MVTKEFTPVLSRIFGSRARTKLVAVLVERRGAWLTAAELCDLADVSQSGFHRDHKSVLLDFGVVEQRETGAETGTQASPKYRLADTEQAEYVTKLHYALQSQLEDSGALLEGNVREFVE
ncbi:hypothetical protein [Halorussus caseinilyticus]|uniref:ArsR family transcriptional regulator n=1 Tax=Halorussus caseinilyticus TaxID=3034025 RepID=A0ABD5WGV0_9EURY|nr:hypothetical protein [Halorussus sp. DT72]